MEKVDVNGPSTSPVWTYLKGACESCGGDVGWNFAAKFIVDKQGNVLKRTKAEAEVEGIISGLM